MYNKEREKVVTEKNIVNLEINITQELQGLSEEEVERIVTNMTKLLCDMPYNSSKFNSLCDAVKSNLKEKEKVFNKCYAKAKEDSLSNEANMLETVYQEKLRALVQLDILEFIILKATKLSLTKKEEYLDNLNVGGFFVANKEEYLSR